MTLARLICPGLALAAAVYGHPAPKPSQGTDGKVTVYDTAVPEPTVVVGPVVWENHHGQAVSTNTLSIVVLPTSVSVGGDDTTTTTMTSTSTTTIQLATATGKPAVGVVHAAVGSGPSPDTRSYASQGQSDQSASHHVPTNSTDTASSSSNSSSDGGDAGLPGVSYSPYTATSGCKSQPDVDNDFQRLKGDYSLVRLYGTDCNQVNMARSSAKDIGVKLFLGIFDLDQAEDEANKIVAGMNGNWDMVHTVSVGNELVNSGQATPEQVISGIKAVRPILRAAGYTGPVVTVDTFNAAEAHPELCEASDYCAVNAHPFFDSTSSADQAGPWLAGTIQRIKASLPANKKVVITETGWPTKGTANGDAVPSMENQKSALSSIKDAFTDNPGHLILFSAFNNLWKQKQAATFDAEQYWGIGGAVSASDE